MRESVTIDEVIALMNEALVLDASAVLELCEARVKCNKALAKHPTIQAGPHPLSGPEDRVGIIGILNGLFGVDERGFGPIAAEYADGPIKRIDRFIRTPQRFPERIL